MATSTWTAAVVPLLLLPPNDTYNEAGGLGDGGGVEEGIVSLDQNGNPGIGALLRAPGVSDNGTTTYRLDVEPESRRNTTGWTQRAP